MTAPLLRVGILGAAKIAPPALIEPSRGLFLVTAIAARDELRARDFAAAHGIAKVHSSYEALIADPEVDLVYVALPAAAHVVWAMRALEAGKHVLSEKPLALGVNEALTLVDFAASRGRLLMEAHHSDYHPLREEFSRAVAACGQLLKVRLWFDAPIQAGDIRLEPCLGAGVLLDFGCYLVRWLRWISPEPYRIVSASADLVAPDVDRAFRAELVGKESALLAELSCDMSPETTFRAGIVVEGALGSVRFDNPLGVEGSGLNLRLGDAATTFSGEGESTFKRQARALVAALRGGPSPCVVGAEIVETHRLVEELYAAAGLAARRDLAEGAERTMSA